MNKTLIFVSLLSTIAFLPSVISQGCTACPSNCGACTFTTGGFSITRAKQGYSIDALNNICYPSCQSNEYYNPNLLSCQSCGFGCATCTYNPNTGGVSVNTAQSGYFVDRDINVCYQCGTSQYRDPWRHECFNCPDGCLNCEWTQTDSYLYKVTITKPKNGYAINDETNTCLVTCPDGLYYNANLNQCKACPEDCATCVQGFNGISILSAERGFSIDYQTNTCYRICNGDGIYYSSGNGCKSCPTNCADCYESNGVLQISRAKKGFSIDNVNSVCYEACNDNQYYDYGLLQCVRCPTNCNACYYDTSMNRLVITGAQRGYEIDSFNGECYASCKSNQYYRAI